MNTRIHFSRFDPAAGIVPVTFRHAGVTHNRAVNAVLAGAEIDREATRARVAEVAAGVARKIELGLLA